MPDLTEYRARILEERELIVIPEHIAGLADDLVDAYKSGRAIENILLPVFNGLNNDDFALSNEEFELGLAVVLESFKTRVFEILENERSDFLKRHETNQLSNINLFELANTINLYLSNKYTRVISENLGHRFEDIATLSPRVINPESHLGFKIKGIDVIIFNNSHFHFCQLKTKKDTLTGSQKGRSEIELEIHPSSIFVACLSLGSGFTFNSNKPNIVRMHGAEFWSILGINYDSLVNGLSESLQEIEQELFNED